MNRDNQASFILIISDNLSLIIKLFHHFSPNLSKSDHDSPDQNRKILERFMIHRTKDEDEVNKRDVYECDG